jgi:hypothetical protein
MENAQYQGNLSSDLEKFRINKLGQFLRKYFIDESHGVGHSMNVLINTHAIYNSEVIKHPILRNHERILYTSAALHDMCDRKYMNPDEGITAIEYFLTDKISQIEIDITKQIISTMSYSKVKKNGFPELNEYQLAYHIVREADLLAAYDVDRSMMYHMNHRNATLDESYQNARELFLTRVLKHNEDNLFFTEYGRTESVRLHDAALQRMSHWNHILSKNLCDSPSITLPPRGTGGTTLPSNGK